MLFTSGSVLSVAVVALSVVQPVFVQANEDPYKLIKLSPTNNSTDCGLFHVGPQGISSGSEFCATQFNVSDASPTVISRLRTWSDSSCVRALEIVFSNNKYIHLGQTPPNSTLLTRTLDLKPSNSTLGLDSLGATKTDSENIKGIGLSLTNGDTLFAGNMTGFEELFPVNKPVLVGLSGYFGTNGLESITWHIDVTMSEQHTNDTVKISRRSMPNVPHAEF